MREASGPGAASRRARGGRALELAGRGNVAPLTGSRRPKPPGVLGVRRICKHAGRTRWSHTLRDEIINQQ